MPSPKLNRKAAQEAYSEALQYAAQVPGEGAAKKAEFVAFKVGQVVDPQLTLAQNKANILSYWS